MKFLSENIVKMYHDMFDVPKLYYDGKMYDGARPSDEIEDEGQCRPTNSTLHKPK